MFCNLGVPQAHHLQILAKVTLTLCPMIYQVNRSLSPNLRPPQSFSFPISLRKALMHGEVDVSCIVQPATSSSAARLS